MGRSWPEERDNRGGPRRPLGMLISGIETSRWGMKPSDVLALQRTLMRFFISSGFDPETSGACKKSLKCYIAVSTSQKQVRFQQKTNPIMARNEEMVGSEASIPIRILVSHNIDVVKKNFVKLFPRVGHERPVYVMNDVGDADGEEEGMSLLGMASRKWAHPFLDLVHELAFNAVYVVHWTHVY